MLNREALLEQLHAHAQIKELNQTIDYEQIHSYFQQLSQSATFIEYVKNWQGSWSVPSYTNIEYYPVSPIVNNTYSISAVDGSQVYPDRHQGTSCFLINIGSVTFHYRSVASSFTSYSTPHFFNPLHEELETSTDAINAQRQCLEFDAALLLAKKERQLLVLDGSLIFWHLEGKNEEWIKRYSTLYTEQLSAFYEHQLPLIGYISLPYSRDLVSLVRLWMSHSHKRYEIEMPELLKGCLDTDVLASTLLASHRTSLFVSQVSLTKWYDQSIRPYFFYLNTGYEIARIEVPAWIAQQPSWIERISSIMLDQAIKGKGYPVVLSEAHQQAVIKSNDRDFFYYIIAKLYNKGKINNLSYKELKKRNYNY